MLNEFGRVGGFEIIKSLYESVIDGSFKPELDHILSIHKFLKSTLPLWTRQFSCLYSLQITDLFGKILELEDMIALISLTPEKFQVLLASFSDL